MAYDRKARTNYFRVKDPAAFEAWAEQQGFRLIQDNKNSLDTYGLLADEGWPLTLEDSDDIEPYDLVRDLAQFVVPGEIVVAFQITVDSFRYLMGDSIAFRVTSSGVDKIRVDLDDIYNFAKQRWGVMPSEAMY